MSEPEEVILMVAKGLGAEQVPDLSDDERGLLDGIEPVASHVLPEWRSKIAAGNDPLGGIFIRSRSNVERRPLGATYTPLPIVESMVAAMRKRLTPARVIDPGCGSGRFLLEAAKAFPHAQLTGFDIDPIACIMARGNLASEGLQDRAKVICGDYNRSEIGEIDGQTLFIGNPPYVRHHLIRPEDKALFLERAGQFSKRGSALAGLHVHFFVTTAMHAKRGDQGAFITSAEWLDVNYGAVVRDLFVGHLGGTSITVIEPEATPFPETATTAAVTSFSVGEQPTKVVISRIENSDSIGRPRGARISRERLQTEQRWSHLTRPAMDVPEGFIELGEVCRVHRGAVTGANKVWIAGEHSLGIPANCLYPTVTKARELFAAAESLVDPSALRSVIDLPEDLDELALDERRAVEVFLKYAKSQAADEGYVARNRRSWWSVGLRKPAPVLATYMARRPPRFVVNDALARHINVAHGLYPRGDLSTDQLGAIARYLSTSVSTREGRTYAGGLTKFEPREMERLLIPHPDIILKHV